MGTPASGRNAGNVASNERAEAECRERFMVTFNQGYAHYFEYLGGRTSSKGKARLRCKVCGHEFERFGSFAQQDVNIFCPHCHVHRDDVVNVPIDGHLAEHLTEMYQRGMRTSDIASETGVQDRRVRALLKERGIKLNTNRYRRVDKEQRKRQQEKLKAVKSSFGTLQDEIRSYNADKVLRSATRRVESDCRCFGRTDEFIQKYAPTHATCTHCEASYLFFPSMRKYGRRKAGPYCSKRCKIKHNKSSSNIGHRLRKNGSEGAPRDVIKLDEVIERDHGICYICGRETSKADHYFVRGHFTIGDTYPTIDHVKPLARGGTHTWDNVRLACRQCNSIKRDSTP